MPLVQIHVFEDELSQAQSKELIFGITNVVTEVTSDKLRDVNWVTINEVKDGHWGVGATLSDSMTLRNSSPVANARLHTQRRYSLCHP